MSLFQLTTETPYFLHKTKVTLSLFSVTALLRSLRQVLQKSP